MILLGWILAQEEVAPVEIVVSIATWATGLLLLATLGGRVLRGQNNRIKALEEQVDELVHTNRWQRYKLDWLAPKALRNGTIIPPTFYQEPPIGKPFPNLEKEVT